MQGGLRPLVNPATPVDEVKRAEPDEAKATTSTESFTIELEVDRSTDEFEVHAITLRGTINGLKREATVRHPALVSYVFTEGVLPAVQAFNATTTGDPTVGEPEVEDLEVAEQIEAHQQASDDFLAALASGDTEALEAIVQREFGVDLTDEVVDDSDLDTGD
jgi:hypothetical protein